MHILSISISFLNAPKNERRIDETKIFSCKGKTRVRKLSLRRFFTCFNTRALVLSKSYRTYFYIPQKWCDALKKSLRPSTERHQWKSPHAYSIACEVLPCKQKGSLHEKVSTFASLFLSFVGNSAWGKHILHFFTCLGGLSLLPHFANSR